MSALDLRVGPEIEDLDKIGMGYFMLDSKAHKTVSDFKCRKGEKKDWTSRPMAPPTDRCNCIYFALVLAGVGFLLPYNSFIIAVDYFQTRYPGTTIIFDMNLVYILMGCFAVLANNVLVEILSLHTRITFGYVVSFFTLLFVALCEIHWGLFGPNTSYTLNLVAMAVLALGCTVQQSSFYGYTSMLPARYTQAVMAGESAAGFFVSVNRIFTKLLLHDQQQNTSIFFMISIVMVGICFGLHLIVRNTTFVKYYMMLCREKRITLEPTEDAGLMDPAEAEGPRGQYGILKLQHSPQEAGTSGFSFSNPVYEPSGAPPTLPVTAVTATVAQAEGAVGPGPSYKVEDVVVRVQTDSTARPLPRPTHTLRGIRRGIEARWQVARAIWPYMLSIGMAYFATQCLYPGIMTEIVSCRFGSWMPVIIITIFNASDLLGKVIASLPHEYSRSDLLMTAGLRTALIPLLLLCAYPRGRPTTPGEYYAMALSLALGASNGLVGSVPMIYAPRKVPQEHRELAGNIMTLSYNFGLTVGSLTSYLLDSMLGPVVSNGCNTAPAVAKVSTMISKLPETTILVSTLPTIFPINATTVAGFMSANATSNVSSTVAVVVGNLTATAGTTLTTLAVESVTQYVTAGVLGSTAAQFLKTVQPFKNRTVNLVG